MYNQNRSTQLQEVEDKLGTAFSSPALLDQALTHSSYVNEENRKDVCDNERLEFLGDAVLKLVISSYIFKRYPDYSEGDMTKMRAAVVSDLSLSEISKNLGLGQYLLLGKNERSSGGERKKSNLANALEAVIAAIYLDHGIDTAASIVVRLLLDSIEKASSDDFIIDYKSALQELSQKNKWGLPFYKVAREIGPKHKRVFCIEVRVKGIKYGSGNGYSKKEAEQNAAKEALEGLKSKGMKNPSLSNVLISLISKRKKK